MDKMDYIETLIKNITYICKEKNITPHMLGKESGVGKDIITNMNKGSLPSCDKLAKIADYCSVSVDYLLGRTENPNINNNGTSISQKYIGGDANASITNHSEKKTTDSDSDDTISELVAVFKTLDFCDKAKVMSLIAELSTK